MPSPRPEVPPPNTITSRAGTTADDFKGEQSVTPQSPFPSTCRGHPPTSVLLFPGENLGVVCGCGSWPVHGSSAPSLLPLPHHPAGTSHTRPVVRSSLSRFPPVTQPLAVPSGPAQARSALSVWLQHQLACRSSAETSLEPGSYPPLSPCKHTPLFQSSLHSSPPHTHIPLWGSGKAPFTARGGMGHLELQLWGHTEGWTQEPGGLGALGEMSLAFSLDLVSRGCWPPSCQ